MIRVGEGRSDQTKFLTSSSLRHRTVSGLSSSASFEVTPSVASNADADALKAKAKAKAGLITRRENF